eukprot:CAMPEP_0113497926 /NCGR_PEP_ID=MMETSP0014_2-20120614/30880_1 /TAXON_ID=2857 /ORGANISM="Nitzschia sp." /LENGTH=379 /DNA_ID=CAMNT_0000391877 /DNA_START=245 /DNA_END=1384 /DNA_ORIENTATION=- /assembly_acc=CAM_ASM_000159
MTPTSPTSSPSLSSSRPRPTSHSPTSRRRMAISTTLIIALLNCWWIQTTTTTTTTDAFSTTPRSRHSRSSTFTAPPPAITSYSSSSSTTTTMMAEYKPPVQRSVRKLQHTSRFTSQPSAQSTTATNHRGGDSSSTKGSTDSPSSSRRGKTSASATATATVGTTTTTSTTQQPRSSFTDRMRGLMGKQQRQGRRRSSSSSSSSSMPVNMAVVDNLSDFKDVLVSAREKNQLVCVGFFATWCKACQATLPQFARSCSEFPNVQFVHIPVSHNNIQLHQGLGVASLPSAHIYHPVAGLVEDELKLASPRNRPSRSSPNGPSSFAAASVANARGTGSRSTKNAAVAAAGSSSSSPTLRNRGVANLKNVLQTYVQGSCELDTSH